MYKHTTLRGNMKHYNK